LIPKGSQLEKVTSFDSGSVAVAEYCNWCMHIQVNMDYWETDDGVDYGDIMQTYLDDPVRFKKIGPREEYINAR
jgi:hypothetical protein